MGYPIPLALCSPVSFFNLMLYMGFFLGCSRLLLPFPETSQSHLGEKKDLPIQKFFISMILSQMQKLNKKQKLRGRVLGVTSWKGKLNLINLL